jgi:MbtH protein
MNNDAEDNRVYKVVISHEEQYSIWPAERANPLGWHNVGRKQKCLDFIKRVWTDMLPLSIRKKVAQA